jgi:hypothetical protein
MAHLVLVRGLPGSGKTTFAKNAYRGYEHLETDDLFMKDGVYQFEPVMLGNYHRLVQLQTKAHLEHDRNVVVSNTFSRIWEMQPYLDMKADITVYYVQPPMCKDLWTQDEEVDIPALAERNVHGVPIGVISKMYARWEDYEGEYVVRF